MMMLRCLQGGGDFASVPAALFASEFLCRTTFRRQSQMQAFCAQIRVAQNLGILFRFLCKARNTLFLWLMTYQPDFTSSWAKLDRGKEHLDTLNSEIGDAFAVESNRVGLSVEFDRESGYHIFRATTFPPDDLLLRFGLIIGDIVHNLRGALDHLVWELSLFGSGGQMPSNPDIIQFPIRDNPLPSNPAPQDFLKTYRLYLVKPRHRAIIERHQPYHPWHGSGRIEHPFIHLRNLSNDDKHREVKPVPLLRWGVEILGEVFQVADWEIIDIREAPMMRPLKPNAEVVRVKVAPPTVQRNMEVAGHLPPYVGLRDAISESVNARAALDQIAAFVANVIREFEPLP